MVADHHIQGRQFSFCPFLQENYTLRHLIDVQCPDCSRYFTACCLHKSFGGDLLDEERRPCHHFQIVFTDGACSDNGRVTARAGLGITVGGDDLSWSIPVDDEVDPGAPRTNQRAEILAAIEGLRLLHLHNVSVEKLDQDATGRCNEGASTYIVITDSEYVVKGITEWFPTWKRRDWRTSEGKRPANLDLFLKLDRYTTSLEDNNVLVGFYHVPRAFNTRADDLAKRAATSR